MLTDSPYRYYEFFAGGGMARLGLGSHWRCQFANDIDQMKCAAYRANFGAGDLYEGDVWDLSPEHLPGRADLAWASFPCQDLSLAGKREGLAGARSGTFFGFWRLMEALRAAGRAPRALVIENVSGALTSKGGADFSALMDHLARAGWRAGALELDAAAFVPQSRPRLFVIAMRDGDAPLDGLIDPKPTSPEPGFGRTQAVLAASARLPRAALSRWAWWRLPAPEPRTQTLADILDDAASDWHNGWQTRRLVSLMAPRHRQKLEEARKSGARAVGAVYRRMRVENGRRKQRAEVRFDGLAGCLRTPAGGSSRQFLLFCEAGKLRSRPLTPREAARLMGAPEDYVLPERSTAALTVLGDGLAVPIVRHLAHHLLEPLIERGRAAQSALAAAE